jgi:hypothetical protein
MENSGDRMLGIPVPPGNWLPEENWAMIRLLGIGMTR